LGAKNRALVALPIEEVLQTLNDLITYFQLPDAALEHEEKQIKLRSLKNRQNLFKQEVSSSTGRGGGGKEREKISPNMRNFPSQRDSKIHWT